VEKRIGKISNQLIYIHFDESFISEFARLSKIRESAFVDAGKIIEEVGQQGEENDDDE
jgi:hypothetical protein